jgi:hypothetical protein
MTMTKVVGNYLRWFELKRCKRALWSAATYERQRHFWTGNTVESRISTDWVVQTNSSTQKEDGMRSRHAAVPNSNYDDLGDFVDSLAGRQSGVSENS